MAIIYRSASEKRDAGFTLLEFSISILIVGIIASGALVTYAQFIKAEKIEQTKKHIALIENALSAYAQAHYRLPCPADPAALGIASGMETYGGNCFKNTTNANLYWGTEGILPWKELGLPQSAALDGWGRYITYKPSPHLTVDTMSDDMQNKISSDPHPESTEKDATLTTDGLVGDIHNACRTSMWYDTNGNHVNRAKAFSAAMQNPRLFTGPRRPFSLYPLIGSKTGLSIRRLHPALQSAMGLHPWMPPRRFI